MAAKPQVKIVAVGRLRERFWREAEVEYQKRLGAYTTRMEIVEATDEPTPDDASPAQEEALRQKEAERILARLGEREYVVVLDGARGRSLTSSAFAAHLERVTAEEGRSVLTFIIGGSLGLHSSVLERADLIVSFGAFTFPHQLMRIVLLEQIYRAFKIQCGQPYHR